MACRWASRVRRRSSSHAGRAPHSHRRRAAADAAAPFYDVARPRGRRVEREPHAHAARRAPARRCVMSTERRRAGNARFLERFSPEGARTSTSSCASRRLGSGRRRRRGGRLRAAPWKNRSASARWRRGGRGRWQAAPRQRRKLAAARRPAARAPLQCGARLAMARRAPPPQRERGRDSATSERRTKNSQQAPRPHAADAEPRLARRGGGDVAAAQGGQDT